MAKTIKFDLLSPSSIKTAKKELLDYRNSLQGKCEILVKRLSEMGLSVIESRVNESPLGSNVTVLVRTELIPQGSKAVLVAKGKVFSDLTNHKGEKYPPFSTILAIEYGSGISYNKTPNPNADKYGFGVGTYPGQTHAFDDGWYFWNNKTNTWDYTKGVKATMPMYEAQKLLNEIYKTVAREVFK